MEFIFVDATIHTVAGQLGYSSFSFLALDTDNGKDDEASLGALTNHNKLDTAGR